MRELRERHGTLEKINIRKWCVSDDQVMHLATAEALVEHGRRDTLADLYPLLAKHYVLSFEDMGGRAPGPMTGQSVRHLKSHPWHSTWSARPLHRRPMTLIRSLCFFSLYVYQPHSHSLLSFGRRMRRRDACNVHRPPLCWGGERTILLAGP